MKRYLFLGLLLCCSIGVFLAITPQKVSMKKYENEWDKVDKYEADDLPKSADSVVNQILKKAVQEKNTPQVIKALIYKNKYKSTVDYQNNVQIFADFDNLLNESNNTDKALLHSMLAEMYLNYYDAVRWDITGRTDLVDYVPKDIKEWTKNIFKEKALYHFKESVKQSVYTMVPVTLYEDILILGNDSRRVYPTLYDFLLKRAIDQSQRLGNNSNRGLLSHELVSALKANSITVADLALPPDQFINLNFSDNDDLITLDFLSKALKEFSARKDNEALVLTDIERNTYLSDLLPEYSNKYSYNFLLDLEKKNKDNDYNVEVILAIIDQLQRTSQNNNKKERNAEIDEWCNKGIAQYPDYPRVEVLKNKLIALQSPSLRIEGEATVFHPDSPKKISLYYKNIQSVTLQIKDKETNQIVKNQKVDLTTETAYSNEKREIDLDINRLGNYTVKVLFDKDLESKVSGGSKSFDFSVSRMASFMRSLGVNKYEFYVIDRLTGAPISNAAVIIRDRVDNNKIIEIGRVETNSQGFATYELEPNKSNLLDYTYVINKGDDKPESNAYLANRYYYFNNSDTELASPIVNIYTDRSIYRPGQTVYFKTVLLQRNKQNKEPLLKTNQSVNIKLYDANQQVVGEKTLITNDFGSASGEFVLPQGGLTGTYSIDIEGTTYYFRVEEYKRPTFQVTFDKVDKAYAYGDKVKVTGHAENYSGIKLQDAEVAYTVTKRPFFRWWYGGQSEQIDNGTIKTKEDGSFEIEFVVNKNDSQNNLWSNTCDLLIEASVTDLNGETQTGTTNFAIGDVSLVLSADIPAKLDKNSKTPILIEASNLNGEKIETKGTYTIKSLSTDDKEGAIVKVGNFTTGVNILGDIKSLPSAKYRLVLSAKDDKGRDIKSEFDFILFSYEDKRPPIETNNWLVVKESNFSPNKNAEVAIGVSAKGITILYEMIKGDKILAREQFVLNNSIRHFSIPYKEVYGENVTVAFTYMVDEQVYTENVTLRKEMPSKDLKLKMEVFRDKLRPGQEEEWRISVKDNQGNPALAELLASMYDSSLDQLNRSSDWTFNGFGYTREPMSALLNRGTSFSSIYYYQYFQEKYFNVNELYWDRLNWFGFDFSGAQYLRNIGQTTSVPPSPIASGALGRSSNDEIKELDGVLSESKVVAFDSVKKKTVPSNKDSGETSPQTSQIRTNFSETAFFYPHLKTDSKGEAIISFTVPESNTSWKFRALAYDKNLNNGIFEALVTSRKELMVTPNLPRFIREGDKTSISTKISNLSDTAVEGKVRLEFFDPLTDEVTAIKLAQQSQDFKLEKDASASVTWVFDVPSGSDMIGCRVVAESESFSDGEQHVLAVLPNRMLVTESMTMNLKGNESKDFIFSKFVNNKSKSLSNYRLTLEYTGNPAWYAVQALPVLSNPTSDNALSWFASYYVNTLGAFIGKQYPKVNAIITAWKQQGGNKETLVSKLQKDEELKAVLLEETPWVLEAKTETEQMERLSLLFDLNNTKNEIQQATDKLKEFQRNDGGWGWFKGMYSSRSMTQYILYGFSQLVQLNAVEYPTEVREMQMNALRYVDNEIATDFKRLKEYDKDWKKLSSISTNQLEFLYVRSSYRDIPISQDAREAERFYTSVVEKNWQNLNLYERSLLIVLSQRNGSKKLADKILKSVREHATISDEMGMFWANNTSTIFMSQSAVAVHTFIMEAFRESQASVEEMDLLKQWLLKQKQTQVWESTHATIDAIYALLSTGNNWFAGDAASQVKVAGKVIEPTNKELATDYIKESWHAEQIHKDMGNVSISKSSDGPAWGAMYWQYYEDLDKITAQKGELNVEKKLFVEQTTSTGKVLTEVTDNKPLAIGNKVIVRLTVRTDRDMEFVHLKDMRASCFEPVETISRLKWYNNTYYYESIKDASTNFFFDHLSRGTYVFEYPVYVNRVGEYSNGITSIQCMYAPEFVSHTAGIKVVVE